MRVDASGVDNHTEGEPASHAESRRTRVVMLAPSLAVGGAERDIVRVAPRIDRTRFEVIVAVFSEAGPLAAQLRDAGIEVIARNEIDERDARQMGTKRRGVSGVIGLAARALAIVPWFGRLLRGRDVDIAHFFLPHSYAYGMLGVGLYAPGVRTVMSRLSLNYYSTGLPLLARIERRLHPRVDRAVGNSPAILAELEAEGVPRDRLRLIRNGLDTSAFARDEAVRAAERMRLGVAPDAYVMVAVGNLHLHKGHADVLEALVRATSELPKGWRLLVAGRDIDGRRELLEREVANKGLGEHVRFLGEVDDVPALLSAGDLFVHASHHEGLPNAVLEAMAASLPVVATRVGGVGEVVESDGEPAGELVDPHDVAALAAALVRAAADEERLARMGEAARQRVMREYALERCVAEYEALYAELTRR